jgi:hypothetical protein
MLFVLLFLTFPLLFLARARLKAGREEIKLNVLFFSSIGGKFPPENP